MNNKFMQEVIYKMNVSTRGIPKKGLPQGFLYADEVIPDSIVDAKYAGTDNFLGRAVCGYHAPLVVVSEAAAVRLIKAAQTLRAQGYVMKFYDAYRPQRAVDDFVRWGADLADERRKPIHYPNEEKAAMFAKGYICEKSGHTRACAVDLTIVDMKTHQELDMGSIFDFMDARSHHGAAGLSPLQESNRAILREAMCANGFKLYHEEWWHYIVDPEPYPDTYFDFPIE